MSLHNINPSLSRRRVLQYLSAAGAALATGACGGPGSSGSSDSGAAGGGSASGTVNFYHWRAEDKAVLQKLIQKFQAERDGVSVSMTIDPSDQYIATAVQKARDGAVGDALTAFRGAQFKQMVKAKVFTDLSGEKFVGNYSENHIAPGQQDGKQFGLPYQVVFNMPLLNMEAAEKAGISELPKDWPAYLDMLDKLKASGITPIAYPGGDPSNAGQFMHTLVMNNAPSDDMFTRVEAGDYKTTDEWFVKVLRQFGELRPFFQKNATGTRNEAAVALFAQGKAAILPSGSFQIGPARQAGATFSIDLAPPITVAAGEKAKYEGVFNATYILGVNARGNRDAARAWLEFLSQPENASEYANGTAQHVTVRGVEYTNKDLKQIEPWLSRKTLLNPRFQILNENIYKAIENAFVSVADGASPDQAAEATQGIIDQQLKKRS